MSAWSESHSSEVTGSVLQLRLLTLRLLFSTALFYMDLFAIIIVVTGNFY